MIGSETQQVGEPVNEYHTRYANKTAVLGMLDRESRQVRAKVVKDVKRETLQREILNNVCAGSAVYTDQAVAYDKLKQNYIHDTVNHIDAYVKGREKLIPTFDLPPISHPVITGVSPEMYSGQRKRDRQAE
jgi:hypothetical protein